MPKVHMYRRLLAGVLTAVTLSCVGTPGFAQSEAARVSVNDPVFQVTGAKSQIQIVERFSKLVTLPQRILRVDGFDPAVIAVTSVTPNQFRIQAVAPGVTTIVFADEFGDLYTVETFVMGDVRHLQAYINRLFPGSTVTAVSVKDGVVLRGWVSKPQNITAIVEIAERFYPSVLNQMNVAGPQQVILKVKVMEVQRSKIRQLGFNFLYLNDNSFISNTVGQLTQLADVSTPFGGPPGVLLAAETLSNPQVAFGIVNDNNIFQGFLEALKQESLLKILAEPTLNTANGRPAQMLAGGEFPILVPQSLGTTTIEWREFGVRLEAVPTMLGGGRVRLELQPEVSERDFSNAVNINGLLVPGLTTRRVNTQVDMKFGQTYMLAGLLSLRRTASTNKVPLLGELPLVGTLFRRVQYNEGETELVIMVTPEVAGPMDPSQVPPSGPGQFSDVPTDKELYHHGLIEVPSYGGRCPTCEPGMPSSTMHYAAPGVMNGAPGVIPSIPAPAPGPAPIAPEPAPQTSPMPQMIAPPSLPAPGPETSPAYDGGNTPANTTNPLLPTLPPDAADVPESDGVTLWPRRGQRIRQANVVPRYPSRGTIQQAGGTLPARPSRGLIPPR